MSEIEPKRDAMESRRDRRMAREKAIEAALAAFADGKADLAKLLPGRVAPVRNESLPRLVW